MNIFFKKGEYFKSVKFSTSPRDMFIMRSIIDNENTGIQQFRLALAEVEPGNSAPEHKHNCDEIFYVLEGKGTFRVEEEEYEAEPGDSLYVKADALHGPHTNTGEKLWRYLYITGQLLRPQTWHDTVIPSGEKPRIEQLD